MPTKDLKDKPAPVPKQTKPKAKAKEKKEAKQTKQLKAAEKGKPTSITRFTTLFKFLLIVFLSFGWFVKPSNCVLFQPNPKSRTQHRKRH